MPNMTQKMKYVHECTASTTHSDWAANIIARQGAVHAQPGAASQGPLGRRGMFGSTLIGWKTCYLGPRALHAMK